MWTSGERKKERKLSMQSKTADHCACKRSLTELPAWEGPKLTGTEEHRCPRTTGTTGTTALRFLHTTLQLSTTALRTDTFPKTRLSEGVLSSWWSVL